MSVEINSDKYPAPDWELKAFFRGPSSFDLTSDPSGSIHILSATATASSSWEAGVYAVSLRAFSGDDVFELESGQCTILADISAAPVGHDARNHAQRTLAAIEAVLESRASKDQESYSINGRSLVRTPIAELLLLRATYKKEVAKASGSGRGTKILGRKIKVRM
ncbi:hypothetical protein [Falsihalocynthiibacter arcticus]|uniref:hypothetical protein n=1 Tax=Falsihalocynthiibacter arcticus TaxID=1579316 RepID=UPI00300195AD